MNKSDKIILLMCGIGYMVCVMLLVLQIQISR